MQYQEGHVFDDRYELKQYKGSGSFGEVWLALDRQTEVEVAVKIYIAMDQRGMEEFKKEFQVSFELNHTNLLHANYLEISKADNRPYLVMPFCPQGSVTKFQGSMTEEQVWVFLRDVARGLEYLHKQDPPIVHQDIKPENILIAKTGDYVITDFGISHKVRNNMRKASAHLNSAGAVAYMGPERFESGYSSMMASDIWSLGVTIYELIMGDVPFCGMGGGMLKQGAEYPNLPDEFSKEINQTMKACLALETWDRPTAEDLADYATRMVKGETCTAPWIKNVDERFSTESAPATEGEEKTAEGEEKATENVDSKSDNDAQNAKTDINKSVLDVPADEVKDVKEPAKSGKGKLIGIIAAVVVVIGGIAGYFINANNEEAELQRIAEAEQQAIKHYNDSIMNVFDGIMSKADDLKMKGDRSLEERDKHYIPAMNSCISAYKSLEEYKGDNKESLQNKLSNIMSEIGDSISVYLNQLYNQRSEYQKEFDAEELEVDDYYQSLLKRIKDCEEAKSF